MTNLETGVTDKYNAAISVSAKALTAAFSSQLTELETDTGNDLSSAENRITTAYEGKISASAQALTADFNTAVSGINGELNTHKSSYHVSASEISSMVSATDTLRNTITSAGWITTADGNTLWANKTLEDGETLVSTINQTAESVKILAKNISLEGMVTVNNGFQVLPNGSIRTVDAHLEGDIYTPSFIITEANWREALLVDYDVFPYINWEVTGMNVQINYWPDLSGGTVYSDILSFPDKAQFVGCEANILVLVPDTTEMQFKVATKNQDNKLAGSLRSINPFEYLKLKLIDANGINAYHNERYIWVLLNRQDLINQ